MRPHNKPWNRGQVLAFMATLAFMAGDTAKCETYLLELLSFCAFADYRPPA